MEYDQVGGCKYSFDEYLMIVISSWLESLLPGLTLLALEAAINDQRWSDLEIL